MTIKKIDEKAVGIIAGEKTVVVADEATEKYIADTYKYFADDIRSVYLSDVTSWATARKMVLSALLCLAQGKRQAMDEVHFFVTDTKINFAHGLKKAMIDSLYDAFGIEIGGTTKSAYIPARLTKGAHPLTEADCRKAFGSSCNLKYYVRNARKQAKDAKEGKKDANGKAIRAPRSVVRAEDDANASLFKKGAKARVEEIVTGLKAELDRFASYPVNKVNKARRDDIIREFNVIIETLDKLELLTADMREKKEKK